MKNYFKYSLFIVVLAAALIMPRLSLATTSAEIQAQINAIMEQIKQLQTQLTQLQTQQTTAVWCHDFNVNLKIGEKGEKVKALYSVLIKEGFDPGDIPGGFEENITFSDYTASAVTGFQQKYADEILTPLGLKYGTGFVGSATRAKLNKLYGCGVPVTPIPSTTPSITVLSPNGGEQWKIGSRQNIKWEVTSAPKDAIVFLFLVNSKKNETFPIDIGYGNTLSAKVGSYIWTIPDKLCGVEVCTSLISETSYQIKVILTGTINNQFQDITSDTSDAPFNIVAAGTPSVTVLSPNGGEAWSLGSTQSVRWTSLNVTRVSLDLVNSAGSLVVKNLVNITGNPGSVNWVIPTYIQPGPYWMRVGTCPDSVDSCTTTGSIDPVTIYDTSNAAFSIVASVATTPVQPSITVLSPNGGETYTVGQPITIKWKTENVPVDKNIRVYLSYESSWSKSQGFESESSHSILYKTINDDIETWNIDTSVMDRLKENAVDKNNFFGKSYKIKIYYDFPDGTFVSDISDNTFTINSLSTDNGCSTGEIYSSTTGQECPRVISSITVLSPNGGETIKQYETFDIKWTSAGVTNVHIYLWFTDGGTCKIADVSAGLGKYTDVIMTNEQCPNIPKTIVPGQYKILIYGDTEEVKDSSDAAFSIVAAAPSVDLKINGSDGPLTLTDNQKITATWTSNGTSCYITNVRPTPGAVNQTIENLSPSGSRDFYSALSGGNNGVIAMQCGNASDDVHTSLSSTTQPSITVLSPNGGEQWAVGSTQTIRWSSSNVSRVVLDLVNSSGGLVVKNLVNMTGNPGSAVWTIPTYISPGQYWLRVGTCPDSGASCTTTGSIDPVTISDSSDAAFSIVSGSALAPSSQYSASILENIKATLDQIQKTIDNWGR